MVVAHHCGLEESLALDQQIGEDIVLADLFELHNDIMILLSREGMMFSEETRENMQVLRLFCSKGIRSCMAGCIN